MSGLHAIPTVILLVSIIIALILTSILLATKFRAASALVIMIATVLAGGGILTLKKEHAYDARDRQIAVSLAARRIRILGFEHWDQRVVIQQGACIAVFELLSADDLQAQPDTWPLVSHTGKAIKGCTRDELSNRFSAPATQE